jgi:hypothetical protein
MTADDGLGAISDGPFLEQYARGRAYLYGSQTLASIPEIEATILPAERRRYASATPAL